MDTRYIIDEYWSCKYNSLRYYISDAVHGVFSLVDDLRKTYEGNMLVSVRDGMHGLNTYDYGARQYNPITARWDRVDPHSENYYPHSQYAYCNNTPMNAIDPDGKDDYIILTMGIVILPLTKRQLSN